MLEPVELEPDEVIEKKTPEISGDTSRIVSEEPLIIDGEKVEDIRIDTLKADIENKFISTLLLEIEQLKERLSKKEKAHDELTGKQTGKEGVAFISKIGKSESEMEGILKKIARLEAILENLKKKIEADIENLQTQTRDIHKPGIFWFLNDKGRFSKMLFSELNTKKALLDIIDKQKAPSYSKIMNINRSYIFIPLAVAATLIISWIVFTFTQKDKPEIPHEKTASAPSSAPATTVKPPEMPKIIINEKEIRSLLEDIKNANLNKDLNLWESRYSINYLELKGRKDSIIDQWKKYDFTSLEYRIDDLKVQGDTAVAVIAWDMDLFEKNTGWTKKVTPRLHSQFIIEDGKLKISSVKKLGQ